MVTDVNALSVIPVDDVLGFFVGVTLLSNDSSVSGFLHEWVLPSSFLGREPLTYG